MVLDDTLKIRNLPPELTDEEKQDFLKHFGAIYVRLITSESKQRTTAFAKFKSKEIAKSVMIRLHQITLLSTRLCVEYAPHSIEHADLNIKVTEAKDANNKKHLKSFINRLTAWNSSVSFHQPPPAHLRYAYPKANRATINNIAHALASVPKFYTQVLHLMNKMNLPPPFSDVPDPPQLQQRRLPQYVPAQTRSEKNSSESEIESDGESKGKEIIPMKRTLPPKKQIKRPKLIKLPTVIPTGKTGEKAEDVFDKVDMTSRKIEVKVAPDSLELIHLDKPPENVGSFGSGGVHTLKKEMVQLAETSVVPEVQNNVIITDEELAANRIAHNSLDVMSVFKNYHPGAPSCRLYVKNIGKNVELKDLEYIYKKYISTRSIMEEERISQFDIRLMQEGRMKGQAFITLETVEMAQKALKETNGFILKDKPLVVVFARSAAPKKS